VAVLEKIATLRAPSGRRMVQIFEEAVFVLHAFEKKTRRTSKADIALARAR
jgi:phage-related protein